MENTINRNSDCYFSLILHYVHLCYVNILTHSNEKTALKASKGYPVKEFFYLPSFNLFGKMPFLE